MTQDSTQALPGFEELIVKAVDRAGSQDLTSARYTAANVLRDYPETFRSIAAAIFKYNLPNRVIRDLYHVNGMTIKGIHDMVMCACARDGARGEFLIKCRAASTRSIVQSRILDALIDKLDNPDVLAKMSVGDLTDALKSIEPPAAKNQPDDAKTATVQVVEPSVDFEGMLDGLVGEKTRGALGSAGNGAAGAPAIGPDCSTASNQSDSHSVKQSHGAVDMLGVDDTLCNSLRKDGENGGKSALESASFGRDSDAANAPENFGGADSGATPAPSINPPLGGGGDPGGCPRGGLKL